MDQAVHHAIDKLLDTFAREFDDRVPPSGPFAEYAWEVPLPPPYGPSRRLTLRVFPGSDRLADTAPSPETNALRSFFRRA